jgi:stage II sporulation protein P
MIAVGRAFCQALEKKGITAIHCTVMLDSPSLQGSYERSAETVREYLKEYPEITYVIDLHRDALTDREGSYIRTLATGTEQPTAQVMAVVGTDCNGSPCANWKENLALALQLKEKLNQGNTTLCRPVSLRNASYYQGIAPRQLLLEIGSGGNTVEEAIRAAQKTAECLADIWFGQ